MDLKRKLARLTGVGPGGKAPTAPGGATPGGSAPPSELRQDVGLPPGGESRQDANPAHVTPSHQDVAPAVVTPPSVPRWNAGSVSAVPPQAPVTPSSTVVPTEPPPRSQDPRIASLKRMLADWSQRQETSSARRAATPAPPPPGPLPVEARTTAHGTVHVSERVLSPDHHHGSAPLAAALDVEGPLVASLALHAELAGVDFQRMLFLDTETTGLAGGTGTVPFLVGLAWFEGRSLRVHQLFLRRLGEESPMLRVLAERMAQSSCLVTFNGKSFDWPLLRTRFVLNRVTTPAELPHLDLLHCARRVFKHRGAGTRLVHMEEQVLGHRRIGDVDGALIPELYFRFLRGGDGSALTPVLEHNVNDLLLLAALLGELVRRFRAGGAGASVPPDEDPRDLLGFAGVALRARDYERAQAFARAPRRGTRARWASRRSPWPPDCHARPGTRMPRRGTCTRRSPPREAPGATLHLELAKLYEHRLKDLPKALHHARLSAAAELPADHQRRITRLEERLARGARAYSLDLTGRPQRSEA
ncbi:ribonuclease H-like domain-containing protein [Pyxidicoccus sp. 3LG]